MEGKKRKTAKVRSTKTTASTPSNVFAEWNEFDVSVQLGKEFTAVLPQYGEDIGDDRSALLSNEDIEKELQRARTREFCGHRSISATPARV